VSFAPTLSLSLSHSLSLSLSLQPTPSSTQKDASEEWLQPDLGAGRREREANRIYDGRGEGRPVDMALVK